MVFNTFRAHGPNGALWVLQSVPKTLNTGQTIHHLSPTSFRYEPAPECFWRSRRSQSWGGCTQRRAVRGRTCSWNQQVWEVKKRDVVPEFKRRRGPYQWEPQWTFLRRAGELSLCAMFPICQPSKGLIKALCEVWQFCHCNPPSFLYPSAETGLKADVVKTR